jgi:Tfp pilus assembly protein PilO
MSDIEAIKKNKHIKFIAIIILLLAINVYALNRIAALFSDNIRIKADIAKKTQELSNFPDFLSLKEKADSEIEQENSKINAIKNNFFSNVEEIFFSLSRFAEADKISLKAINPSEKNEVKIPNSDEVYLELPITIKLECGFYQLLSFLENLESLKKTILINKIKIQSNPNNIWEHDIELAFKVPFSIKN